MEELKSKVRSKVEHAFGVLKHRFGYRKVRYKGLIKNEAQLYTLFALVNVVKSGEIMGRQGVTVSCTGSIRQEFRLSLYTRFDINSGSSG